MIFEDWKFRSSAFQSEGPAKVAALGLNLIAAVWDLILHWLAPFFLGLTATKTKVISF